MTCDDNPEDQLEKLINIAQSPRRHNVSRSTETGLCTHPFHTRTQRESHFKFENVH